MADSSFLYAAFDRRDDFHAAAKARLEDPDPILIPLPILVETLDLLRLRLQHSEATRGLAALLELAHVRIADAPHMDAVRASFEAGAGRLSLADSVVVATCRALALRPETFDRAILAQAG